MSSRSKPELLSVRACTPNTRPCSPQNVPFPHPGNLNSCHSIFHLYCHWGPWELQLTSLQWQSFVFLALDIKRSLVLNSGIRPSSLGLHPEFLGALYSGGWDFQRTILWYPWDGLSVAFFFPLFPGVRINLVKYRGNSGEITYLHTFSATDSGELTGLSSANHSNQRCRRRLLILCNFPMKVCVKTSTFHSFFPNHPLEALRIEFVTV